MPMERTCFKSFIAASLALLSEFLTDAGWLAVLALCIVFVDLRFGVKAAHKRGEIVRFSKAMRRTVNKMLDYLCWILVAVAVGRAIGAPMGITVLPSLVMLFAVSLELDSIGSHWMELRDIPLKDDKGRPISFLKYLMLVLSGNKHKALEMVAHDELPKLGDLCEEDRNDNEEIGETNDD